MKQVSMIMPIFLLVMLIGTPVHAIRAKVGEPCKHHNHCKNGKCIAGTCRDIGQSNLDKLMLQ